MYKTFQLIDFTIEKYDPTDRVHVLVLLRFDFDDIPCNDIYPNIHNNVDCKHMQDRYAYRSQRIDSFAAQEDYGGLKLTI